MVFLLIRTPYVSCTSGLDGLPVTLARRWTIITTLRHHLPCGYNSRSCILFPTLLKLAGLLIAYVVEYLAVDFLSPCSIPRFAELLSHLTVLPASWFAKSEILLAIDYLVQSFPDTNNVFIQLYYGFSFAEQVTSNLCRYLWHMYLFSNISSTFSIFIQWKSTFYLNVNRL